jgi:hypothetical protein
MWKYIFVLIEHHTPPPALSAKVFSRGWKFPLRLRCPLLGEANVILTACNPKTYSWIYITTGVRENIQHGHFAWKIFKYILSINYSDHKHKS